ncbi:MAG: hypothetical protein HRF46_16335 [Acidobacteriota bacterium]
MPYMDVAPKSPEVTVDRRRGRLNAPLPETLCKQLHLATDLVTADENPFADLVDSQSLKRPLKDNILPTPLRSAWTVTLMANSPVD